VSIRKVIERLLFLVVVIWTASTITFFIPRISSRNPIRERFGQLARTGGFSPDDLEIIIESYNQKFGLDKPLWEQYADYIGSIARLDLGVSLYQYPKTVSELIQEAIPWTLGLLVVTTILSFIIGNVLGAVAAWPRAPRWLRSIATPFILFMGVPPVLLAVFLLFFVAFRLKALPLGGAYSIGVVPNQSLKFYLDVLRHQLLPALALIFCTVGGWVLLPQVTGFALALGNMVTSGIVIEQLFGLPGIGTVLYNAIKANDYLVIYGVVLFITIAIATLMVLVELLYPLLDPRIRE
jgi:peptide/nickel transport system permease protein